MFANIRVKEPLEKVVEDWDYLAERVLPRFSTLKVIGQNNMGIRRRVVSTHAVDDPKKGASVHLEIGPQGILQLERHPFELVVTTAGTPHHVTHNFGYWHINDMDEISFAVPAEQPGELGHTFIIQGTARGKECDRFAWYCAQCVTLMYEVVFNTGEIGMEGFWRAERAAVNAYNADPALRRCPECGAENPLAYCWNPSKDNELERQARAFW
jgi:hypothetical protein